MRMDIRVAAGLCAGPIDIDGEKSYNIDMARGYSGGNMSLSSRNMPEGIV